MNNYLKAGVITTILMVAFIFLVDIKPIVTPPQLAVGSVEFNQFSSVSTSTSVNVGLGASTLLVATTSGRQYLVITNGSTVGAYVSPYFAAGGSRGVYLAPNGGMWSLNSNSIFTGAVYASGASSTASTTLSVVEK